MHLGGLRTALYNYVFAKQNKGQFILRIEDTDQKRLVPESAQAIEHILNWAKLEPDESPIKGGKFGPYAQSERLEIYNEHAKSLLESGKAYRCFCSQSRLELLRKQQAHNREKPHYDGKCKHLSAGEVKEKLANKNTQQHVIRFALTAGLTSFSDMIFGTITNNLVDSKESDPVLLKSDGFPTYHFANVIDDKMMQISHVLRGSEWLSSTAKHVQLYDAFGWRAPQMAHFPLISMIDGSKMSKRNEASAVQIWIDNGYTPDILFNFLTQAGGGVPKDKQDTMEFWSLDELIEKFKFDQVTCHAARLDMNRLHAYAIKGLERQWRNDPEQMLNEFKNLLKRSGLSLGVSDERAKLLIGKFVGRIGTLNDLLSYENKFIWQVPVLTFSKNEYCCMRLALSQFKNLVTGELTANKQLFVHQMKDLATDNQIEYAQFMKFLRLVMTNEEKGLPVQEIIGLLGAQRLISYIDNGLKYLE